jgi:excisionase family DNA binding protein
MVESAVVLFTPEQVAEQLGLHVKTVRRYIRDGQLPAVRIGKRSRVTKEALEAFMGVTADESASAADSAADVSCVVIIDRLSRDVADRTTNHLLTAAKGRETEDQLLRIEAIYDPAKERLKVIVNGGIASTTVLLSLINALING